MQDNKAKNVVFLKDLESNIIKEAIIILKDNANISKMNSYFHQSENIEFDLLKEAELLINNKINNCNKKIYQYKIDKVSKSNKRLKILNTILLGLLALSMLIK